MSSMQRYVLLALAAVVLVVGFVVLRPGDDDESGSSTVTVTTVQTTPAPAAAAEEPTGGATATTQEPQAEPQAAPKLPTIVINDGEPVDGVKNLAFNKGDTIAFKVRANAPGGEVHFHGYDVAKEIPASGGSVTFRVPADIEGIFEVEMEATGTQIAKVEVQP